MNLESPAENQNDSINPTEEGLPTKDTIPVVENKYVAFCDILGFSNRVSENFDETLKLYADLSTKFIAKWSENYGEETTVTMYSDSILVTGSALGPVLQAVQGLSFFCLAHNFLLRGGIAYGRYWEQRSGEHLLVVSDALIKAVKLEQMVSVPVVVLADDIEIPEILWLKRFDGQGPFATPLLHFRDRNVVNPFNMYWGTSAPHRARQLMEASPAHSNKYLWFLALYDALVNESVLVPEHIFNSFVDQGIIGPPEQATDA